MVPKFNVTDCSLQNAEIQENDALTAFWPEAVPEYSTRKRKLKQEPDYLGPYEPEVIVNDALQKDQYNDDDDVQVSNNFGRLDNSFRPQHAGPFILSRNIIFSVTGYPNGQTIFQDQDYYEPVKRKRKRRSKKKTSDSEEDFSIKVETDKLGN